MGGKAMEAVQQGSPSCPAKPPPPGPPAPGAAASTVFNVGTEVVLVGLVRRPHLNGRIGVVLGYSCASRRHSVEFDGSRFLVTSRRMRALQPQPVGASACIAAACKGGSSLAPGDGVMQPPMDVSPLPDAPAASDDVELLVASEGEIEPRGTRGASFGVNLDARSFGWDPMTVGQDVSPEMPATSFSRAPPRAVRWSVPLATTGRPLAAAGSSVGRGHGLTSASVVSAEGVSLHDPEGAHHASVVMTTRPAGPIVGAVEEYAPVDMGKCDLSWLLCEGETPAAPEVISTANLENRFLAVRAEPALADPAPLLSGASAAAVRWEYAAEEYAPVQAVGPVPPALHGVSPGVLSWLLCGEDTPAASELIRTVNLETRFFGWDLGAA